MGEPGAVAHVLRSSVRTDVLSAVSAGPTTMDELIDALDASESAVYSAVGDLDRRGLVRSLDEGWAVTGSGRVVADVLDRQAALRRLLGDDYWRRHDVGALPRRFRVRLPELADATVYRGSDTDPHAAVREICERIEAGSPNVDVVAPIYQAEYEAVMPDSAEARLVIDATVAEDALSDVETPAEARTYEETDVRVANIDLGVAVTDDHVMLSLPTIDGQYDSRTEVIAQNENAISWGRDLFEHYWSGARPSESFVGEFLS